jgi:hypothetical protein
MGFLYKVCLERTSFIKGIVKNFVEIWEHEWDIMIKSDFELKDFCKDSEIRPALKPREALYGGRTNAAKLYHLCEKDEKIKYFDVTSLYPYVQKTQTFPLGASKIITEVNQLDVYQFFGLINCRILPPKKLLFPVLPARIGDKLLSTTI